MAVRRACQNSLLSGKKILLGVTGSIAAYKSLQIVRGLRAAGAQIDVVMTSTARDFASALTLQVFSGRPVLTDLFDPHHALAHLTLAEEADLVLIAPATANFIAKMSCGLADDLLSTLLLATRAPVFIAPAMDIGMWEHPAVLLNRVRLCERGVRFIGPENGPLASGKVGMGRMTDETEIIDTITSFFSEQSLSLKGETVLVTAGPTQEPIDPVRFISNRSSGKMGYALADTACQGGARVILISGPTSLPPPGGVDLHWVRTAAEMREKMNAFLSDVTIVVMAAAVSDYKACQTVPEKLKKNGKIQSLRLEETEDILASRRVITKQIVVGFAAETESVLENAQKKLKQKKLDLIVANDVTKDGAGFDVETNIVQLIDSKGKITSLPKMPKKQVAQSIFHEIERLRLAVS